MVKRTYLLLVLQSASASQGILLVTTAYCLWGLTNIGLLYDQVTNQSSVFIVSTNQS